MAAESLMFVRYIRAMGVDVAKAIEEPELMENLRCEFGWSKVAGFSENELSPQRGPSTEESALVDSLNSRNGGDGSYFRHWEASFKKANSQLPEPNAPNGMDYWGPSSTGESPCTLLAQNCRLDTSSTLDDLEEVSSSKNASESADRLIETAQTSIEDMGAEQDCKIGQKGTVSTDSSGATSSSCMKRRRCEEI